MGKSAVAAEIVMRKFFLIALVPVALLGTACKASHGGNCNCPKFGKGDKKQQKTEQVAAAKQEVEIQ